MPAWVLLVILGLFILAVVVLGIAMFTEMGTKRKTGAMKSTRKAHKERK